MAAMYDAIILWIHILSAVAFIGPQFFLVAAAVPAMQTIEDVKARARATRVMSMRFGILGGGALVVLLITGMLNYIHEKDAIDTYQRYFITLQIKLTLVALVVILTILHGAVFGRRLQQLTETNAATAEIAKARRLSMFASIATMLLSIAILFCAALLGSEWSQLGAHR
jgi:putative copper resistance protein D